MIKNAKWIWIKNAPNNSFCVAQFQKEFILEKEIIDVEIKTTADTFFQLYVNGEFLGRGPHCAGGDYDGTCKFLQDTQRQAYYRNVLPYTYVSSFSFQPKSNKLHFFAEVRYGKILKTDGTAGKGGFILQALLTFIDGTTLEIGTDKTWEARLCNQRTAMNKIDYTKEQAPFMPCVEVENVWNLRPTEIENLAEEIIEPINFALVIISAHSEQDVYIEFDKVYAGYPFFEVQAKGETEIFIEAYEKRSRLNIKLNEYEENTFVELKDNVRLNKNQRYVAMTMTGCGGFVLHVKNNSDDSLVIEKAGLIFSHYPITNEGVFECSNERLNEIYQAGKNALNNCRQSIHLDSVTHQENLGCTGDYYVESLMEYYAYGETKLTRFDLLRTADLLRAGNGRMFHTTYSLIYLQMLWDYYAYSGDKDIFYQTEDALSLLFDFFQNYEREDGILDNLPNYLFIDWLEVDGYSLHHPPKALGQTVMNALYYKALCVVKDIYQLLWNVAKQGYIEKKISKLKGAFFNTFFDEKEELFFDGLGDKIPNSLVNEWQPQNPKKRYYSVYGNALAVLYGLCPIDKEKDVLRRILTDKTLIYPQPYCMHFVVEAIWKSGLFAEYGLQTLLLWIQAVDNEKKVLKEGWIEVGDYGFDLSHAWAGSPTYQLPIRLLGLEMIEPKFKKVKLNPCLYGLDYAKILVPTPYGELYCEMRKGKNTILRVPNGIEVI